MEIHTTTCIQKQKVHRLSAKCLDEKLQSIEDYVDNTLSSLSNGDHVHVQEIFRRNVSVSFSELL